MKIYQTEYLNILSRYERDNYYLNDQNTYWSTTEKKQPYVDKLKGYLVY